MIEAQARDAIKNRATNAPILQDIFIAENINQRNGGTLVTPWSLHEIPEDYLTAYLAMIHAATDVARETRRTAALEKYHSEFRRDHPSYRKY